MVTSVERIFYWLKSYLVCHLKGGDMERLFNLCRYNGIEFWNMSYQEGVCQCCIALEDFWKIRPFLRKTKVRIRIKKRCGLSFLMAFLNRRKGLWIGMLGCIFVLYFLSAHIWKFEFYGNSYYTDERLTKYLEETENIRCGIWKQHIDGALLEENLRLSFPDISWVSVRMEGTSLIISLEEMVKYEKSEDALQFPRYICAAKDGEILSMVTRSGTPKAIVGQEVKAGDLLIDGSVEIMDDSMTVTEIMTVGADGDIWAKVVEPYKKRYDCSGSSKKYERASWKICLSIGGHSFSFGKNPYEDQIIPYHCFSEMWEPLSGICLQINRYRPYEIVPSLETISQAKSRAEEELSDTFREFDEKGVQILENNVKILMYEDRVEADGYFVLIEPIGKASDHFSDGTQIDDIGETHEYNRNDD